MSVRLLLTLILFQFIVTYSKIYLHETFDQPESESRWVYSDDKSVTHGVFSRLQKTHCDSGDFGIKSQNDSSYYHFSTELKEALDTKVKPLIVGFVIQYEQTIDCGGGYIKLFEVLKQGSLTGTSPYSIMFGPDVCGYSTKKTHFIVSHKGQNLQMKDGESFDADTHPHLLMLKIDTDRSFYLKVDDTLKKKGYLKDQFDYLLPKKIDDPSDKKPDDWVDEEMMADPTDTKPADWVDEETIPDPDAKKPEDWDDVNDGEWEPEKIKNPAYKGEWAPKQIKNPAYKGEWTPKQIDNPDYTDDTTFADFKIKYVGFDIWTVKAGTVFDDIFICDSQEEADEYSKSIMSKIEAQKKKITEESEKIAAKEEAEKPEEEAGQSEEVSADDEVEQGEKPEEAETEGDL